MPKPVYAWSHSSLEMYEQCPKKFYHLKIAKDFKEDFSGDAANYGKMAHKAFEDRLKSGKRLPLDLTHHEKMLAKIQASAGEGFPEQRMALNTAFEPTGYFDKDVWVRGQADYAKVGTKTAAVFDWKFGKQKDNYDQLNLMAAMFLAYFPELTKVRAAFYWAKDKEFMPITIEREKLPEIWNGFIPRVSNINKSIKLTDFPAKESGLCKKYCPITTCPKNGQYK